MTAAPKLDNVARRHAARLARAGAPERREAVIAAVMARGGLVPWADVLAVVSPDGKTWAMELHGDMLALIRDRRLFGRRIDGAYLVTTNEADLPPVVVGPTLALGEGQRRETCRNYNDCLSRFVATKHDIASIPRAERRRLGLVNREYPPGHCPPSCASFAPIPRESSIGLAMMTSSPLARAQDDAPGDMRLWNGRRTPARERGGDR